VRRDERKNWCEAERKRETRKPHDRGHIYTENEKEPTDETIISGMKFAAASLIFVVLPPIGLRS
jgi:hypothetical protein